jgi:hypothetical protein
MSTVRLGAAPSAARPSGPGGNVELFMMMRWDP